MKNKQIICYIYLYLYSYFNFIQFKGNLVRVTVVNIAILSLQNKKYYSKYFNKELVLLYWVHLHYPYKYK